MCRKLGSGSRPRRRSTVGAVLLVALASVSQASAQQLFPFRIGSQTPPIFEYIYINYAIEGGFLKSQGIDGKFVGFTAGLTTTQALAGGSLEAACDGLSGTVASIARGSPAKTVYSVNADSTYVIVTRDTISRAEELRGKKWAITQMGAISQTYAALWLSRNGLPDNSVDWIPIGGTSARARAVIANQVDVTLLTAGEWFRIREQKGVRLLATISDSVPPLPLNLCAVTNKLINERSNIVQGLVNGILNAVRHARTPEGRQAYIKIAQQLDPAGYTDKQYDELYEFYFGPKGNPLALDPNGGMYPEVFVANMKSMVAEKALDTVLPLEKLVDARFVNQYLGDNGWYDATARKGGNYLRDMLKR
jgi:ABC-type nitrate/sulfonate/bicarbonate transport system substrate-binding protein